MTVSLFATADIPNQTSLGYASEDEDRLITVLLSRLTGFGAANRAHQEYYEGTHLAEFFGISVPPVMRGVRAVTGWAGTAVDVLEERLDWLGWRLLDQSDLYGLDEIVAANRLDVESSMGHLDALIYGCTFVTVGSGQEGEPHPLITVESPLSTTGIWDPRSRQLSAALTVVAGDDDLSAGYLTDQITGRVTGQAREVTLYRRGETATFTRHSGRWLALDRDPHLLPRVPVVQLENRPRGARRGGRSEITPGVRYLVDAAARTLLGAETNREFYSAPQRYALGVDEEKAFTDQSGNVVDRWTAVMSQVWAIGRDENGELPVVGEFKPASPAPYLDLVRGFAQMLAAEAAIPATYLGFETANPASADAIRASEARLVKRAERRQGMFGHAWSDVARLALAVRDGVVPADFQVANTWRDAATPTRAAQADAAVKLVGAGVLPATSTLTYDLLGITPEQQRVLDAERRSAAGRSLISQLVQPVAQPVQPAQPVGAVE